MFTVIKTIFAAIAVVLILCTIFVYLLVAGAKTCDQKDIEKEDDEQERYIAEWMNQHRSKAK